MIGGSKFSNKKKWTLYRFVEIMIFIIAIVGIFYITWLEFSKQNLDSSDILGAVSNILGGIIGVIGAFLLFKYQVKYTKEEESKFNYKIIQELLSYTVSETQNIIDYMIDIYIGSYVPSKKLKLETADYEILKKKVKGCDSNNAIITGYGEKVNFSNPYEEGTFSYLVQCLGFEDFIFTLHDKSLITKRYDKFILDMMKDRPKNIRQEIVEKFRKLEDNNNIVYYDNWKECLNKIIGMELKYNRSILIWLNSINKTIEKLVEEEKLVVKYIEELEKDKEQKYGNKEKEIKNNNYDYDERFSLERDLYMAKLKQSNLNKDIISRICNFIYYRDEVIKILRNVFKVEDIRTSTEILNHKFDEIKIQE